MMDDDLDLDGLLAEAALRQPEPSAALLARIEADAQALQPRPAARPAPPRRSWLAALADVFGGGGGVAGLTLAAASGLWLGVAQPAGLLGMTEYLTGTMAVELLPTDDSLFAGE